MEVPKGNGEVPQAAFKPIISLLSSTWLSYIGLHQRLDVVSKVPRLKILGYKHRCLQEACRQCLEMTRAMYFILSSHGLCF